eukprot:350436-Chlamydomonas_euryale.AAC.7
MDDRASEAVAGEAAPAAVSSAAAAAGSRAPSEPDPVDPPLLPPLVAPIPDARLVAVQFPGYVRNVAAAMAMLGGREAVAAAARSGGPLRCSYRPHDPTCRPLFGDAAPAAGLVVRISRGVTRKIRGDVTGGIDGTGGDGGGREDEARMQLRAWFAWAFPHLTLRCACVHAGLARKYAPCRIISHMRSCGCACT